MTLRPDMTVGLERSFCLTQKDSWVISTSVHPCSLGNVKRSLCRPTGDFCCWGPKGALVREAGYRETLGSMALSLLEGRTCAETLHSGLVGCGVVRKLDGMPGAFSSYRSCSLFTLQTFTLGLSMAVMGAAETNVYCEILEWRVSNWP